MKIHQRSLSWIQQLIAADRAKTSKTESFEDDLKIAETALGWGSKTFKDFRVKTQAPLLS
jgi:hypothetical protein